MRFRTELANLIALRRGSKRNFIQGDVLFVVHKCDCFIVFYNIPWSLLLLIWFSVVVRLWVALMQVGMDYLGVFSGHCSITGLQLASK